MVAVCCFDHSPEILHRRDESLHGQRKFDSGRELMVRARRFNRFVEVDEF